MAGLYHVLPLATRHLLDAIASDGAGIEDGVLAILSSGVGLAVIWIGRMYYQLTYHYEVSDKLTTMLVGRSWEQIGGETGETKLPSGDIVNRLRDDSRDAIYTTEQIAHALSNSGYTMVAVALTAEISGALAVLVVLPAVVTMCVGAITGSASDKRKAAARQAEGTVAGFLTEILAGVLSVKAFGTEEFLRREQARRENLRREKVMADKQFIGATECLFIATRGVSIILVLWVAASRLSAGFMSVGDFALVLSYVVGVEHFVLDTGRIVSQLRRSGTPLSRLSAIAPVLRAGRSPGHAPRKRERIDPEGFSSLDLHGFVCGVSAESTISASFGVRGGTFTVVTGAVGVGKTSLLKGITGHLPSLGGTMYWNGRRISPTEMRPPLVSFVPQTPWFFSDTLRENLTLGRPYSDSEIGHAVYLAALDEDIASMSGGLGGHIGSAGSRLSGGQRLRVALARALLLRCPLCVIDDLSSGLDPRTERQITQRLSETNSTFIVVSSRRETVRRADRFVYLQEGVAYSSTDFGELASVVPGFSELWKQQHGIGEVL